MTKHLPDDPQEAMNQLWNEPDTVYYEQVELIREQTPEEIHDHHPVNEDDEK